jgi:hypothetical protein
MCINMAKRCRSVKKFSEKSRSGLFHWVKTVDAASQRRDSDSPPDEIDSPVDVWYSANLRWFHFFSIDDHLAGSTNPQAHLVAVDAEDSDGDVLSNHEGFGRAGVVLSDTRDKRY